MNKKKELTKASVLNVIDFMMAQTGITRQQAAIAIRTILTYMQQNPAEPLHRLISLMFGSSRDHENRSLN